MIRSLGQRTSVRDRRAVTRGALDQRATKPVCPSRVVHVERLIVDHDTSHRRAGGTTITMNRQERVEQPVEIYAIKPTAPRASAA